MVTVGGSEPIQPPPPGDGRSRGLLLAVLGVATGLALGSLFTGNGPPGEIPTAGTTVGEPASSPTTAAPTTTTTT
ncbi:MAG: hypothetical protein WD990_01360, partial [Acidimicrobiia bacterium]